MLALDILAYELSAMKKTLLAIVFTDEEMHDLATGGSLTFAMNQLGYDDSSTIRIMCATKTVNDSLRAGIMPSHGASYTYMLSVRQLRRMHKLDIGVRLTTSQAVGESEVVLLFSHRHRVQDVLKKGIQDAHLHSTEKPIVHGR